MKERPSVGREGNESQNESLIRLITSEANYPALLQGKSLKATSNPDPTEGISEGELYSCVFRLPIGLEPIMVTIAMVSVHPSRLLHSTIQAGDGMARFQFRPPTTVAEKLEAIVATSGNLQSSKRGTAVEID